VHYLDESNLLIFLVQILVLLTTAKILGELCQRRGIPALAGEILTGILLGPTILGRALPALEAQLFPIDLVQQNMLETVSWFGVLFLLLATGFEVNISTVWKQGKTCLIIGVVGVAVPMLVGCTAFWWLPPNYWGANADHITFTLFLATAASISAITVIAKVLHDLDILKSDLGLMTLSAFIVNDVLGWMVFTFVLGVAVSGQESSQNVWRVLYEIVLFGTVCLTVGSKIVGAITVRLQRSSLPQPATTLTFICCLGLLCGALTQWTGIHAILGFLLAGIMAGNTPEISEKTRQIISQMIHAIFVPIFFAGIGLKVDFLHNFDLPLAALVTVVAMGGKFTGAWVGGGLAGLSKRDAFSIGIAHIPGGATEIILGMLALKMKLISDDVFVAIVFAALASSIIVGPLLSWSIRRRAAVDVGGLLLRGAVCLELKGKTRWEVIPELAARVAKHVPNLNTATVAEAVEKRERIMGTGLQRGVAVPHARLAGIEAPLVAFGRAPDGIDWDARDGLPSRFVFLILTPEGKDWMQLQILACISRMMTQPEIPEKILEARNEKTVFELLNQSLTVDAPPARVAEAS